MGKINPETYQRGLRARFVHRAIETDAPLLAPLLHRYAAAEGMTWDELAHSLDCSVDALNQIAICYPPHPESFVADVEAIAADHVDPDRLLPLLRRLQVLTAFADRTRLSSSAQVVDPGNALPPTLRIVGAEGRVTSDQAANTDNALLLAARDRDETTEQPPSDTTEDDHA